MEANQRYQISESLWERLKNVLDQVGAETGGADALAALRPSFEG